MTDRIMSTEKSIKQNLQSSFILEFGQSSAKTVWQRFYFSDFISKQSHRLGAAGNLREITKVFTPSEKKLFISRLQLSQLSFGRFRSTFYFDQNWYNNFSSITLNTIAGQGCSPPSHYLWRPSRMERFMASGTPSTRFLSNLLRRSSPFFILGSVSICSLKTCKTQHQFWQVVLRLPTTC